MSQKKACKVFAVIIVLIALVMAILVSVVHQQALAYIIFVSRFFDVMLPILAVGALVKYIMGGHDNKAVECKCDDK